MMPSSNPSGGFTFGQPQATSGQPANQGLFGTAATTTAGAAPTGTGGFSFSTAAPQPAAAGSTGINFGMGSSGGGFTLGQPATAATTTAASGFSFNTAQPAAATTASAFTFGTPAPTTSTTTTGGFNLGGQATNTGGFSLGGGQATSTGGFNLGGQTTNPGGFNLGGQTTNTGGFSLGGQSTNTGGFNLGGQTSNTGGFNLGGQTTNTGGFNLGGQTTNTGFTLGGSTLTPASTAASSGFSFGTTPAATTTAAATTTGFSFGLGTATTSSVPTLGFGSGGGLCVQTSVAGNKAPLFGLGAATSTATSTAAVAPVSSVGLGGIGMGLGGAQPPSASTDTNSSGAKMSGKSTKDQQLTPDLFATIAVFEARKTAENSASEENIRQTAAPFHKIGAKAKEIQKVLAELASDHLQLQASTSNLKGEVMKEAEHVEMAKRTKETPMALQGDNKAPEVFFINLVRSFEADMMYCRTKIDEVSQCMQAASNPCETEEDIAEVLQREHDTLKDLAAKVYAKHSQLVELSHVLNTKAAPNEQEFFRPSTKEDTKTPASAVVRPVLGGGGSGLLAFQEQQQRAKAVTLGAAPPTMPLTQTSMPAMFSGGSNTSGIFSGGGSTFGSSNFGTSNTFGSKPLFGGTATNFSAGSNPVGLQQSATASPFTITSPFNTKPFGTDDDGDSRRKRRL